MPNDSSFFAGLLFPVATGTPHRHTDSACRFVKRGKKNLSSIPLSAAAMESLNLKPYSVTIATNSTFAPSLPGTPSNPSSAGGSVFFHELGGVEETPGSLGILRFPRDRSRRGCDAGTLKRTPRLWSPRPSVGVPASPRACVKRYACQCPLAMP